MIATSSGQSLWYVTRASGLVAMVLLTAVVVLGIVATAGWTTRGWPRFITQGLHRNLTLVALGVLALHIVTTVADGFAPIGLVDAVLPFHSPYRPLWLSLGSVAFDLLVAVTVTSMLRRHIGYRTWKVVHWASYAMWPLAVLHGLGTGSDTRLSPVLLVNGLCALAVAAVVAWRLSLGWPHAASQRVLLAGASVVVLAIIGIFVALGPLKPGWALRAGTPVALLKKLNGPSGALTSGGSATSSSTAGAAAGSSPSTGGSSPPPPLSSGLPTGPFRADLSGSIRQSAPDSSGNATVDIAADLSGGAGGHLDIVLTGPPDPGGGLSVVASQVTYAGAQGQVVRLDGDRLASVVTDASGNSLLLDVRLQIDPGSGTVTGTVTGQPQGRDEQGAGQ